MTISASASLRVVVLLTSFALALLLLLAGVVIASEADGSTGETVTARLQLEVSPGDTLWEIASVYTEPGDDVREKIHDIKVANGLESSVIVVGQVLFIPLEF